MSELIRILPAIALRGTTILPDMIVHFDISRSRSIKAVEEAMLHDQKVFLVTQKDPDTENPKRAAAVIQTLTAVTFPAPRRLVIRSLARLDTIVPPAIIMETAPAQETFAPSS